MHKTKLFIYAGCILMATGLISYLTIFFSYSTVSHFKTMYLTLLVLVLFGYVGVPFLLIGFLQWTFRRSIKVKVILWLCALGILLIFSPLLNKCFDYRSDIRICDTYLPYQLTYWQQAYITLTDHENIDKTVEWDMPVADLIINEGVGDLLEEIKNVLNKFTNS